MLYIANVCQDSSPKPSLRHFINYAERRQDSNGVTLRELERELESTGSEDGAIYAAICGVVRNRGTLLKEARLLRDESPYAEVCERDLRDELGEVSSVLGAITTVRKKFQELGDKLTSGRAEESLVDLIARLKPDVDSNLQRLEQRSKDQSTNEFYRIKEALFKLGERFIDSISQERRARNPLFDRLLLRLERRLEHHFRDQVTAEVARQVLEGRKLCLDQAKAVVKEYSDLATVDERELVDREHGVRQMLRMINRLKNDGADSKSGDCGFGYTECRFWVY